MTSLLFGSGELPPDKWSSSLIFSFSFCCCSSVDATKSTTLSISSKCGLDTKRLGRRLNEQFCLGNAKVHVAGVWRRSINVFISKSGNVLSRPSQSLTYIYMNKAFPDRRSGSSRGNDCFMSSHVFQSFLMAKIGENSLKKPPRHWSFTLPLFKSSLILSEFSGPRKIKSAYLVTLLKNKIKWINCAYSLGPRRVPRRRLRSHHLW